MAKRYEQLKPARFTVEWVDGSEVIRIPARRNWLVLPFLAFWLLMWTVGGVAAVIASSTKFDLFLLVWLVAWAAGWLIAASIVLWQIAGAETLSASGGDLEIGYSFPGFRKSRLYRGGEIRGLAATGSSDIFGWMNSGYPPFLNWMRLGSIKFNYGARTIRAAAGLDEPEGQMIVDHLRKRLPASAADG